MAELKDAIAAVTVLQIADHLGILGLKIGMNKSPFREVKSGAPFSIPAKHNGHAFKDHGFEEHRGNSWKFLELARPNLPKKERAEIMFRLAGMEPGTSSYSKSGFRHLKREYRKHAYQQRETERLKLKEFDPPKLWTTTVASHWHDGAGMVPIARLAASRGWPEEWILSLIELDKIAYCWLPWGDPKFRKARHGLCFKVEYPIFSASYDMQLHPGGFHQQWLRMDAGKRKKDWLFIPHVPGKCSTAFQRALQAENNRIAPFPFVLGNYEFEGSSSRIRNIIITEGQWDAASVYGAAGWFSDSAEPQTIVFGLRGSQSIDVFMSFYAQWIRRIKPNVLLIPDNDTAGKKWIEQPDNNKIIQPPTFAERLKAWGAPRVEHRSIAKEFGKDFNDYYKARKPSAADMLDWFTECGLQFD